MIAKEKLPSVLLDNNIVICQTVIVFVEFSFYWLFIWLCKQAVVSPRMKYRPGVLLKRNLMLYTQTVMVWYFGSWVTPKTSSWSMIVFFVWQNKKMLTILNLLVIKYYAQVIYIYALQPVASISLFQSSETRHDRCSFRTRPPRGRVQPSVHGPLQKSNSLKTTGKNFSG